MHSEDPDVRLVGGRLPACPALLCPVLPAFTVTGTRSSAALQRTRLTTMMRIRTVPLTKSESRLPLRMRPLFCELPRSVRLACSVHCAHWLLKLLICYVGSAADAYSGSTTMRRRTSEQRSRQLASVSSNRGVEHSVIARDEWDRRRQYLSYHVLPLCQAASQLHKLELTGREKVVRSRTH